MSVGTHAIDIRTSPHIKGQLTTDTIMLHVVYALLPVTAFAVFVFGLSALLMILVTTGTCVLTEHLLCKLSRKQTTVGDYSAVITGLLLALCLPPAFPLWMAVVGGVVSIGLGKALFGGLGMNPFNPALVGRAFLQAAFPVAITTWAPAFWPKVWSIERFTSIMLPTVSLPFMRPESVAAFIQGVSLDGLSGATPLAKMKFEHQATPLIDLFVGMTAGSAGEASAFLIILGGIYLCARKMMNWRVPVSILVTASLVSGAFYLSDPQAYPTPMFMLFSGGLMLGAVFMASDMVGSPMTPLGIWIYGALIGAVTVLIRLKGGLPEGTMYAILLGNACTPLIDNLTQPRIFGARKKAVKQ
ncbi:MAG: RnfABCDGE type electron transport complex subunit D [Candidatus Hydrogenedentes bacterium]|nr:RnfABCDGE type electron transport complex subunit D [Candidatus Hydrogenedentota bacterium]